MAEKNTILIVEDDLDLAEMLNAYFRVQGYDVLTAAWGEDAVRVCRETPPDIVVLDIRLPDIDGYEVCRQLRSHRRTESLPIIFLTERRERVDKLQGLSLGVVDYITKPFDIQELRLRVHNALRRANQQSLVNPITDLPERALVDERLDMVVSSSTDWGLVLVTLHNLDEFREVYGFVASDDVIRAIALMTSNIVRDAGNEGDFIGHLDLDQLIVVTTANRAKDIKKRSDERLTPTMEYFYPLKDRLKLDETESQTGKVKRLSVEITNLAKTDIPEFESIDQLKAHAISLRS